MNERYMQIILEEMNSKFALMVECFATLDRKIDRRSDELSERIDLCNFKIDALARRVDSVEMNLNKRIDSVEMNLNKRIDSVEENLARHIDAVAADLTAHRADTEGHRGAWQVRES